MTRKIFIIYAYPEKSDYSETLIARYTKSAMDNGSEVKKLDLASFEFDPILWNGYESTQEPEPGLREAKKLIKWADHIVFSYPLWWGGMPALLKGFIERVFLPGFAFKFGRGGKIDQLFANKTARIFVTMHTSPEEYIEKMSAAGEKMLKDGVLEFCGIEKVETNYFGSLYKASDEHLQKWIETAQECGTRDSLVPDFD